MEVRNIAGQSHRIASYIPYLLLLQSGETTVHHTPILRKKKFIMSYVRM